MSESTAANGRSIGLKSGDQFWIVGRAGVMGDCTAETAVSALAFHGREQCLRSLEQRAGRLRARRCCRPLCGSSRRVGERELARFDAERMETLDTLGRRIIDLAPPDEVREQRLMAEQRTAQILEPYFHALNDDELTVFGEIVETTRIAIDM